MVKPKKTKETRTKDKTKALEYFKKSLTKMQETKILDEFYKDAQKNSSKGVIENFGDSLSIVPNVFLQTMLFRPISSETDRKFRRFFEEVCGFSNSKYEVMVFKKGDDLDQNDLDLFLWLVSRSDPETFSLEFKRSEAIKGCGRSRTKENYMWLEESLDRLTSTNIKFYQREVGGKGGKIYRGGLINYSTEEVVGSEISGKNKLSIYLAVLPSLLLYDKASHTNRKVKGLLRRQQLAQFLYGWFKCNNGVNGFNLKKDIVLSQLKKEGERDNHFIKRLKTSGLDPLVKLGILKDYEFEKDTIFLVWDKNYDNKKNKEIETKKTIRSKYGPKKPVKKVTKKKAAKEEDDGDFQGYGEWEV